MPRPKRTQHYHLLFHTLLTLFLVAGCIMPAPSATNTTPASPIDDHALPTLTAADLADGARLQVVATTNIVADVVAQVGGDRIDLTPLMPTGIDPHSFTATPQDLIALNEGDVIFVSGLALEEGLLPVLTTLDSAPPLVAVNVGVTTLEFAEGAEEDEHAEEHAEEHEHTEEEHTEEEHAPSAVAHACKHLADGPIVPVNAVTEISSTMAVTGTHVRLDVTVPTAEPSYFVYTAAEAGDYIFYADRPVTLTLQDADGTHAAETIMDAAALTDCPGLVTAFVFDLAAGDNTLALTDTDGEIMHFVVEAATTTHGHDHADEAHDHDHAEAGDEHEHHHHSGADPHTWFSVHAVEQWVTNIEQVLSTLDPANAATYTANADAYRADLTALASELDTMVAALPVEQRKLVTDHEALGYFADAYDFTIIGAVIPSLSTMAAPSASELAALQDQIEAEGVRAIFVGITVNPALAEQLAADTGASVAILYTESLSAADGPAATYLDFMRYNMQTIVAALK